MSPLPCVAVLPRGAKLSRLPRGFSRRSRARAPGNNFDLAGSSLPDFRWDRAQSFLDRSVSSLRFCSRPLQRFQRKSPAVETRQNAAICVCSFSFVLELSPMDGSNLVTQSDTREKRTKARLPHGAECTLETAASLARFSHVLLSAASTPLSVFLSSTKWKWRVFSVPAVVSSYPRFPR